MPGHWNLEPRCGILTGANWPPSCRSQANANRTFVILRLAWLMRIDASPRSRLTANRRRMYLDAERQIWFAAPESDQKASVRASACALVGRGDAGLTSRLEVDTGANHGAEDRDRSFVVQAHLHGESLKPTLFAKRFFRRADPRAGPAAEAGDPSRRHTFNYAITLAGEDAGREVRRRRR